MEQMVEAFRSQVINIAPVIHGFLEFMKTNQLAQTVALVVGGALGVTTLARPKQR